MKLQMFSVFDIKAQSFSKPMFLTHKGEAIRAFQDVVKDGKSMIALHPEDYKLYALGFLDDVSGEIVGLDKPEFMNNASDFISLKI